MPNAALAPTDGLLFSARLRALTRGAHAEAEQHGALDLLITGRGDLALYRRLLQQLHFVYEALEDVGRQLHDDPVAGPFVSAQLLRAPALRADLSTVCGPDWESGLRPLPSTTDYVARLRTVGASWSGAFVAHHYTRYLGDLSGGLAVGAAVDRHLGLTESTGAGFFAFPAIAQPQAFKQAYRRRLDDAAWTEPEREQMVAEVLVAYGLNTALQRALVDPGPTA